MSNNLLRNLEQLHSTELGMERVSKNLGIEAESVVSWCTEQIQNADSIVRQGKNWYVYIGNIRLTVNAQSYSIITAHKGKCPPLPRRAKHPAEYTREDLLEALQAIESTIRKCEKVQPKLKEGTAQHTLLVRRIKALRIAVVLIHAQLSGL